MLADSQSQLINHKISSHVKTEEDPGETGGSLECVCVCVCVISVPV